MDYTSGQWKSRGGKETDKNELEEDEGIKPNLFSFPGPANTHLESGLLGIFIFEFSSLKY